MFDSVLYIPLSSNAFVILETFDSNSRLSATSKTRIV